MMRYRTIFVVAMLAGVAGCSPSSGEAKHAEMSTDDRLRLKRDLAFSLAAHKEWGAAIRPLLELATERPRDATIQTLLGTCYREQGLFVQAAAAYEKAIALDSRYAPAYGGRGVLRELDRDAGDGAIEDFRTALRLVPEEASFANNLGFALFTRGRYAEAEVAFQQALKTDPLSARSRNNLGFVYAKLGKIDRAKREFEHAGTEDQAANNLGFALETSGELAAACIEYRRALADNPSSREAAANHERACPDAPDAKTDAKRQEKER